MANYWRGCVVLGKRRGRLQASHTLEPFASVAEMVPRRGALKSAQFALKSGGAKSMRANLCSSLMLLGFGPVFAFAIQGEGHDSSKFGRGVTQNDHSDRRRTAPIERGVGFLARGKESVPSRVAVGNSLFPIVDTSTIDSNSNSTTTEDESPSMLLALQAAATPSVEPSDPHIGYGTHIAAGLAMLFLGGVGLYMLPAIVFSLYIICYAILAVVYVGATFIGT